MQKETLKKSLKADCLTIGSWITLAHPSIPEIMAKAGFDWLVVDLEHSVITIREAEELIQVINLCGTTPLVRLTSNCVDQIKRVMDAGAHGVIVPMVNSVEDAKKAVSAVYYPPKGIRGVGLARAQGYGVNFQDYLDWLKNEAVIIVQVEHIESVNNLEEILAVSEVDGYFIGPYDLSSSMGIPGQFEHPEFISTLEKIRSIGRTLKKPGGIHVVEPDVNLMKKFIEDGLTFVAYSLDIRMLDSSCRNGLKNFPAGLRKG